MKTLRLSDNATTIIGSEHGDIHALWTSLDKYDAMTIGSLREKRVIVFPPNGKASKSNDKDNVFYKIVEAHRDKEGKIASFSMQTSNLMGVISLPGNVETGERIQLEVHSRFDSRKPFFLNYLLSKVVFDISLTDLVAASGQSLWDMLLALVFLHRFKAAAQIGLFKQYHKFEYNDLNFHGKFDLDRHLKRNFPLGDKLAHSRREISFDNPINHLIRHAAAIIERKWPSLLILHEESDTLLRLLNQSTPTWHRDNVGKILAHKDVRLEIRHPFFAEFYEDLRRVSIALLLGDGTSLYDGIEGMELEGVVFDGAWLWEEYLSTLLVPLGYVHANTEVKKTGITAFVDNNKHVQPLYPDFRLPRIKGKTGECKVILDAKYKHSSFWQPEDKHQIFSYMFLTGAELGGLIYPPDGNHCKKALVIDQHTAAAEDVKRWKCFTYASPDGNATAADFISAMEQSESELKAFARDEGATVVNADLVCPEFADLECPLTHP